MTTMNTSFSGSVPEHYHRHLGPFLFEPYARDLVARLAVPEGGRVLELACGTGIVTRRLRAALPRSVELVATDLGEAMLAQARDVCGDIDGVAFQQADMQDLPFEDEAFDAVVCQFGIMFAPDKGLACREAHRVLRVGGRFHANTWAAPANIPVVETLITAVTQLLGGTPPTFFDVPFGYSDRDRIRGDLAAAGFRGARLDTVRIPAEAASAENLARGFVHGTPAIAELTAYAEDLPERAVPVVAKSLAARFGAAPVRAELEAIVITAE